MSCKKKKTDIYIFTNIQQTKKKNNPGKKKNSGHEMNEWLNWPIASWNWKYNCAFTNLLCKTISTNNSILLVVLNLDLMTQGNSTKCPAFKKLSRNKRPFKKKATLFWRRLLSEYGRENFSSLIYLSRWSFWKCSWFERDTKRQGRGEFTTIKTSTKETI